MHELSLAERLVEIIQEAQIRESFYKVKRIHLEIGVLAGVEVEALRFGMASACMDTVAAEAVVEMTVVEGRAHCPACAKDVEISTFHEPCPLCGQHRLKITGGDRLLLKHLEVE